MTTRSILLLVLPLVVAVVLVISFRKKMRRDVKETEATPLTAGRVMTALAVFGAVWANAFLFAKFWPDASTAVETGVAVALGVGCLLLYWRRVPRGATDKKRTWWRVVEYGAGCAFVALELHSRNHRPPTVSSGAGWGWYLIVPGVLGMVLLLPLPGIVVAWMIHKAYERGDHQAAMRIIDRFGFFMMQSLREDARAMVLVYSGEPNQAESFMRPVLDQRKEGQLKEEMNVILGEALIDQGRYAEAGAIFEQVIQRLPERMGGYDGLAEVRILQGRPREAFDLIEQAIRCEEARSGLVRRFEAYEQGHLWANRAWAEAALGWRAKAEEALERALKAARKNKPELAGVHYRAGMLWNVLEQPAKAREHFRIAQELDPEGRYGKKSREAELVAIS